MIAVCIIVFQALPLPVIYFLISVGPSSLIFTHFLVNKYIRAHLTPYTYSAFD